MTAPDFVDCPPLPPTRVYHRAALIDQRGRVSALCFERPRAIDMKRATWTIQDEAVTCRKCLAVIEAQKAAAAIAENTAPGSSQSGQGG